MFIDWLDPEVKKVERATVALVETLKLDDPARRNKTEYMFPREAFTSILLDKIRPSLRSIVLACRLLETHFDCESKELLNVDLETLTDQQIFHQRKLTEALVDLVLLAQNDSKDIFSAYLNSDKAKNRRNWYRELQKGFGANLRLLEVYCSNDEDASKRGEALLKQAKLKSGTSMEIRLGEAWNQFTDLEKHAAGSYLLYRTRSGAIHFSTFPNSSAKFDVNLLLYQMTVTLLLCNRIVVRAARLFPTVLPEVAKLTEPEVNAVFVERFRESNSPDIEIGEKIHISHGGQIREGIVREIKNGEIGKSFRIEKLSEDQKWCSVNDFHPAMFVSRIEKPNEKE